MKKLLTNLSTQTRQDKQPPCNTGRLPILHTFTKPAILSFFLFAASPAQAVSLDFVTPSGIVGPNDTVEVWVRLSAGTTDINFDATDPAGNLSFGALDQIITIPTDQFVDAANNGAGAFVNFDSYSSVITNTSFTCTGSFSGDNGSACPPGANYDFNFNSSGPDSFNFLDNYFLAAGDTQDFLFGSFIPVSGGAQPGTYDFTRVSFFIDFNGTGFDDFGVEHNLSEMINLAVTCQNDPGCFSRQVVSAVPVPAALWLMMSGLIALTGIARRS